ncbi:hypothetical protein BAE44_0026122 [Dichanthelium oligosanthes]|uniref:Mitochondrial acidic protein MAM33 n=1 Tax=Dichanthelium oligosanthes TaxID=888268 RepID=A0A1E5UJ08_9POAL|nr:hypothetical protein BAE44_0026122 [Dichanthelium oligosanthes]
MVLPLVELFFFFGLDVPCPAVASIFYQSIHFPSRLRPCAMFLRRLRTSAALHRGATDGGVLAALRAEIASELSSSAPSAPPPFHSEDAPDFVTVSDAPLAQDLLLRRRADSEEVLVSALLAPLIFHGQEPLPRELLMKVFVSKPGAAPVLRFDCGGFRVFQGDEASGALYTINAVRYHSFPGGDGEDKYQGPEFRCDSVYLSLHSNLDPQLQAALGEYLVARGVDFKLADAILLHLYRKEHAQYFNWLKTMEATFIKYH